MTTATWMALVFLGYGLGTLSADILSHIQHTTPYYYITIDILGLIVYALLVAVAWGLS